MRHFLRVTVLVVLVAGLLATTLSGRAPAEAAGRNPLAAAPLYVDPDTWAGWATTAYPGSAAADRVIADTPQARWFGDWTPTSEVRAQVSRYVRAATTAHRMPVIVLYAIPHRDCGGYSAGGLASRTAYAAWVAQVVKGIKGRRVGVIVEPDALAGLDCLSAPDQTERYAMLRKAVKQLTVSSRTAIYLDAGHSQWLSPAEAARRLEAAGVARVRGFSLNVANFYATADEVAYGEQVSRLLDGAHYVVDTSRDGLGPAPSAPLNWCNPAGRALGQAPTTVTGGAHADAYLWIKHPGESDGDCDRGDPTSGTWYDAYAVGLVQRARTS